MHLVFLISRICFFSCMYIPYALCDLPTNLRSTTVTETQISQSLHLYPGFAHLNRKTIQTPTKHLQANNHLVPNTTPISAISTNSLPSTQPECHSDSSIHVHHHITTLTVQATYLACNIPKCLLSVPRPISPSPKGRSHLRPIFLICLWVYIHNSHAWPGKRLHTVQKPKSSASCLFALHSRLLTSQPFPFLFR